MQRTFAAAFVLCLAASGSWAAGTYDSGASDTEIKIGNTWPFSGPASPTTPIERQMAGYFNWINDQGGVNGRKINFIALDDGYSPPKTVELTRRLVEQDKVLLMFGQLGTPTNIAVRPYLNARKIPQLFVTTGSQSLVEPKKYPWTMTLQATYAVEATIMARYILKEHPDAKIGILAQDDDFGGDHVDPFTAALGDKAKSMIVAKTTYAVTDPTVTSQIISLKSAGADTIYLAAQSRAAAQAISAARDQVGWNALIFLPYVASAKSVVGPVGNDRLKGVISADSYINPTDPQWANDPDAKAYLEWNKKYTPSQDQASNAEGPGGYIAAEAMVYVLKQCGDELTRANVMKQALNMKDVKLPLLLPGIALNTSPDNYFPMHTMQLKRFDGTRWVLIGKPVTVAE
ncbi:MAG TPA: ABC transporter substrate-binding protein [Stellaceae bacterium]|nr:ABC transporter substrate-binding protein [Stellaceae bacterium]